MLKVRSRWSAFAAHLFFSLLIFLMLAGLIYWDWFPGALMEAAGGWQGIRIVAAVDLVLGPLLTLIVFNIRKPARELARDLSLIVALQLSCLAAGVYVVYQARPLAVVYVFDRFYVLNEQDYETTVQDVAALSGLPGDYPKVVYVDFQGNAIEYAHAQMMSFLEGRTAPRYDVASYQPMPSDFEASLKVIRPEPEHVRGGCIWTNLLSEYDKGRVCFAPEGLRFSEFQSGDMQPMLRLELSPGADGAQAQTDENSELTDQAE